MWTLKNDFFTFLMAVPGTGLGRGLFGDVGGVDRRMQSMIRDHLSCSPGPGPCPVSLALAWAFQAKRVAQGQVWAAQGPVVDFSSDDLCMLPAMPAPLPSPESPDAFVGVPIRIARLSRPRPWKQEMFLEREDIAIMH